MHILNHILLNSNPPLYTHIYIYILIPNQIKKYFFIIIYITQQKHLLIKWMDGRAGLRRQGKVNIFTILS